MGRMKAQGVRTPARESILDAADQLLGRFGYQKTTLDDLAREAKIGRRTIYLHFQSKEEIFLASIDRVVERLCAELARIAADDLPPAERLRRMLLTRVLFRFDSVHGYYQSLDEMLALLRTAYLERRSRYFADEAKILAEVLAEGTRARVFDIHDPAATARALVLATNALLPYSLSTRELGSRKVVEAEAARIAELLLSGLSLAGPKAPGSPHTTAARSRRQKAKIQTDNSTRDPKP
jgi:AcrR family transcriptional regulator